MNELMRLENGEVKVDSRMIARHFGKEHKNVLRDISDEIVKLEKSGLCTQLIFEPSNYKDTTGRTLPCYTMTEEGALQLAARYDAVARRKLIIMIKELKQNSQKKLSPIEQLRLQYEVVENHEQRLVNLENTMNVDYGQQQELQAISKKRVIEYLGGTQSPAYKNRSVSTKAFSAIWKDYKDYFQINSYRNTPRKDFDKAIEYLKQWQPNGRIQREIDTVNSQNKSIPKYRPSNGL